MYVVTMGGFDTHNIQVTADDHTTGVHASLLQQLGDAIKAFNTDIQSLGVADRVTGMTYSEFGRRMKSNASGGTDHGEAAPLFLFGKPVKGGITGTNPIIPAMPTDYSTVDMQYDFRSVYSTLLRDWFCVPYTDVPNIMLHNAPYLDVIQQPMSCVTTAVHENNSVAGISYLDCSPNPFQSNLKVTYRTDGGHTAIQMLDTAGRVVATLFNESVAEGEYSLVWPAGNLPAGTYFCRFTNGLKQQTKPVVKI
jgi:hypothetical protein